MFEAFLGPDLSEKTLYHGHSYSGNALGAAVALRHLELIEAWDVLANVRERSDELRDLLDDRIAPLEQVRETRLRGLMGGVELAPPRDGLRWGRRGERGRGRHGACCSGRIGDAVVLMPPLTITSEELHTTVHALARLHRRARRRVSEGNDAWDEWAAAETDRIHAAGPVARAARTSTRPGPTGMLTRPTASPSCTFASNDYLGLTQHPAVVAAAHAALDRWGTGAGAARLIVGSRPVHTELERALAAWKQRRSARCSSPPGSPRTSACSPPSRTPTRSICSDELNHASIIDGTRLARRRGRGLPAPRPRRARRD